MNLNQIIFQYYPAFVKSKKPIGDIDLEYFLNAIKNPSERISKVFRLIAIAEDYGNMKRKASLKQNNLYYFTPCVWTDGINRGYKNIKSWNGLAVLDFDHIDHAEEFKQYVFETYKFIIAGFLSPSKRGVKFIVRIPLVQSVDEFKSYYYGLGTLFDRYNGWDGSGQNCVLPLFLSTDPDILIREDAEVFEKQGKKIDFFSTKAIETAPVEVKDGDQKRIYENSQKAFNSIVDNGHPQLIAICLSLGGYVASGYLSESDAVSFAENQIENHNYLRKGIAGYKKTAKEAINKGTQKALKL